MLHEVDLCVVGIASLAFGGAHHTSLAVGSLEATSHVIDLTMAQDGYLEPPQVLFPDQSCSFLPCMCSESYESAIVES